jgi:hypothetical protein
MLCAIEAMMSLLWAPFAKRRFKFQHNSKGFRDVADRMGLELQARTGMPKPLLRSSSVLLPRTTFLDACSAKLPSIRFLAVRGGNAARRSILPPVQTFNGQVWR